ncbi:MAG TPA: glycosyltransferase family 2 protein [Blastocatellia bacterium]|nr:glycosyltransferase family 2 protein [Blastocatellia bacterium]
MKIGFVCTNYNNSHYTREAVRSLLGNKGHSSTIVIVDNCSIASDRKNLEQIEAEYENVHLILNSENVGYFKGLNCGIKYLRAQEPDLLYMIVGNNDVVFPADFIDSIEKNAQQFQVEAVISPDVVTSDGVHQNPHVIKSISRLREMAYDLYHLNYYLAVALRKVASLTRSWTDRDDEAHWQIGQRIYQGHGACYILGPLFFEHFTELWAPSFLMAEEYFLSKQLADAGLHLYYEPSIRVTHHFHASVKKVPAKEVWSRSREAHRIYKKHLKVFNSRPS